MADKDVQITMVGGKPTPDQDPVVLYIKNNDKVKWWANFDFTVDIVGYSKIHYSNGGGVWTCKTDDFTAAKKYKYSITANGVTNDPDLDVKP